MRYEYYPGWPCPCKDYQYKGKENLFTTIQHKRAQNDTTGLSEYVVFSHVDDKAFADLSGEINNYDIIPTLVKDFSPLYDLLVIKLTTSKSREQLYNTHQLTSSGSRTAQTASADGQYPGQDLISSKETRLLCQTVEVAGVAFWQVAHSRHWGGLLWVPAKIASRRQFLDHRIKRGHQDRSCRKDRSVYTAKRFAEMGVEQQQYPGSSCGWSHARYRRGLLGAKRTTKSGRAAGCRLRKAFLRLANQAPEADPAVSDDAFLDMAEQAWETQPFPGYKDF